MMLPKEHYYEKIFKENYNNIKYIPVEYQTYEMCLEAIKGIGELLEYVGNKTPELCEIAVEDYALSLEFVPEKYKTKELCRLAVEYDSFALVFVSEKTQELCDLAVFGDPYSLEIVPEEFQTEELCYKAIAEDSFIIKYVKNQTPEMVHYLMKNNMTIYEEVIKVSKEQMEEFYKENPHLLLTL